MKKDVVTYIILGTIYLIALFSIFPLLGNENQVDWFGTGIYRILLLIGWGIFYVCFFLVGLVLNKSKLKTPWAKIIQIFKISILGTVLIVGLGNVKYSIDYNNWQEESTSKRKAYEKEKELKFYSRIDSLQNIINSDASNSKAFFELGLTYRHNGEWGKSVENYKKSIEINSTESKYHSELAYSQSILKNYEEAVRHYEMAYSLDTTRKWIKSDIVRCKKMKKKSR